MNLNELIEEIGNDADLLTRSDAWLEDARHRCNQELEAAATELRAIILAQKVKGLLQQKNLVAVQQILRSTDGEIRSIIIRVLNLPDALSIISKPHDALDMANAAGQLLTWENDGYELQESAALRMR